MARCRTNMRIACRKKMILGALRSALSHEAGRRKIDCRGRAGSSRHTRPRRSAQRSTNLNGEGRTIFLVDIDGNDRNLELASRNLDGVKLSLSRDLQAYDLLQARPPDALEGSGAALERSARDHCRGWRRSVEAERLQDGEAKPKAAAKQPRAKKSAKPARQRSRKEAAKPKAAKNRGQSKSRNRPRAKGKGKE